MGDRGIEREIETRLGELGYELVELEQVGSRARPLLRVRIDRQEAAEGASVTIEDCARASRALEAYLDEVDEVGERYVLEVSSPGVERPLVRPADFERFAGREVVVKGTRPLAGRARRLEGTLIGLEEAEGDTRVRIRLEDGDEVAIPRAEIARAHLLFRWDERS
jgi:ribosome maturation factor RimP